MPRDFVEDAMHIARHLPGLGNPLDLTCAEFDAACEAISRSVDDESKPWHRRYVEGLR